MVRDLECKLERGVMKMAKLRKMLTHLRKNESGQGALAIVIILLMLGAIILTPLLVFMSTGLKAGGVYESKLQEFYAADAGVEDGLWRIKNDQLSGYDEYTYSTSYIYDLPGEINNENVHVNITNVWIPKDITAPNNDTAKQIIEGTPGNPPKLIITGGLSGTSATAYQIKIIYNYGSEGPNALRVEKIGIWLPPGFHYAGNCSLASDSDTAPYAVPATPQPYNSGEVVVWSFSSLALYKFPPTTSGSPMVKSFTFTFTGPYQQAPGAALSWIDTTGVGDIDYTWDADSKPYRIESTAGSTTAEAYTIKNELRKLGAAISGEYFATGNSLIGYSSTDKWRDRLYKESKATIGTDEDGINGIPSDATVEAAFLYWTGWIDYHYYSGGWKEIQSLKYPANPTAENLTKLVNHTAKVDRVSFGIPGNMTDVTADKWQVEPPQGDTLEWTWSYCCFKDVTSLVKQWIEHKDVASNAAGEYTLGHANAVINQHRPESYYFNFYGGGGGTAYPLGVPAWTTSVLRYQFCHAGWSLIIIYSSPETKGHQLYLYDIGNPSFHLTFAWGPGGISNPDFDGDGNPGGHISGFLTPEPIGGEDIAAKLTVFVGEGDNFIEGDQLKVKGYAMSNAVSPSDNVWNSKSPGLAVPGVDIDTFYIEWNDGIIEPGDTSAQVDLPTQSDGFNLVYIILSFRSEITTGGTISYLIR